MSVFSKRNALITLLILAPVSAGAKDFYYNDESFRLPPDGSGLVTDGLDVALLDVDHDHDLDIFIANGTGGFEGRQNRLLINNGRGRYTDETVTRLPQAMNNSAGADFADIDGDGDLDIIVANLGAEELLVNDGHGHFSNQAATQLPPPQADITRDVSADARFFDADHDGDMDILIANENPFTRDPAGGAQNWLWLNDGSGHFSDATAARLPAAIDQTAHFAIGDIDGDGDPDVIVVNAGQERVLMNDGHGFFSEQTAARFPVVADASRAAALVDLNRDGALDLLVANSRAQQDMLYFNRGDGTFYDVTVTHMPVSADTSTNVSVADFDDDGKPDAFFTNSGAFDRAAHDFAGEQSRLLLSNSVGKMRDKTHVYFPAVANPSTDSAVGDVNGDGRPDIVVANAGVNGALRLYIQGRKKDKEKESEEHDD